MKDENKDKAQTDRIDQLVEMLGKRIEDRVIGEMAKAQEAADAALKLKANPTKEDVAREIKAYDDGRDACRYIHFMLKANNDPRTAADMATQAGALYIADEITKAMSSGDLVAGGALVPDVFSEQIVQALSAKAIVRQFGPQIQNFVGNSLILPYMDTIPAAAYITENAQRTKTEATSGQLQLSGKKLSSVVPVSNDLIRRGGPRTDASIQNSILQGLAEKEDPTFIRAVGVSGEPKGLRYWAPTANLITSTTSISLAGVTTDLGKMELALRAANVPMTNPGWMFHPRTEHYLKTVRDGNGNYAFRDEMSLGKLNGFPYRTTTKIPITLNSSTESEVYLVDFDSVVIAEEAALQMVASQDASYYDGSALVSAFSRDQTVIRSIAVHDLGCLYRGAEVAVLTAVKWGA